MIGAPTLLWATLAGGAALVPAQGGPRTLSLPLAEGERAHAALLADVDGDGRKDLVLALSRGKGNRELRAHLAAPPPRLFEAAPAWTLPLPADVVAFAAGPVLGTAQEAPVLLNGRGAFVALPWVDGPGRFRRLAEAPVLWQLADPERCPAYPDALVDLDGDGRVELLLPTAAGHAAFVQVADGEGVEFRAAGIARLPDPARLAAERGLAALDRGPSAGDRTFDVRLGAPTDGGRPSALLSVVERLPAPVVVPWGAGGARALLALDDRFLHVFDVAPGGALSSSPSHSLVSPVELDARRKLDVSYVALTGDLDGDGRSDVVLVATDQRSKDVRTQVLVFTHAATPAGEPPLFGRAGRPAQVLVLAGFAGDVRLEDADGDGALDLVVTAVRPDLLEALRRATSDRVEAEFYVYKNEGGRFARRPSATRRLAFQVQDADPLVRLVAPHGGGAGPAGLLLRQESNAVALFGLRAQRDGALAVSAEPRWRLGLNPASELVLLSERDGPPDTLVALEPNQVLVARWR